MKRGICSLLAEGLGGRAQQYPEHVAQRGFPLIPGGEQPLTSLASIGQKSFFAQGIQDNSYGRETMPCQILATI
jgi:hypothetical protein